MIRGIQIEGCYCWSCGQHPESQNKNAKIYPKNATKTCDINTSMIAWFVRFWVFTMYCTKNNTKEAFFGVSTTNLWPDVTYQSSTTGPFSQQRVDPPQRSVQACDRRKETRRVESPWSPDKQTPPRFSPPQDRHCLKEEKKNNAIFWSCLLSSIFILDKNSFNQKHGLLKPDIMVAFRRSKKISGGNFPETPRPQACTSQRWANLPCSTGKSQLLRLGKGFFVGWIFCCFGFVFCSTFSCWKWEKGIF